VAIVVLIVIVAESGGDFTAIQEAIDDITDATTAMRYVILVYPGTYTENVDLTGKPYIDIKGMGTRLDTIITSSSGTTLTVDTTAGNSNIFNFLTIQTTGGML